MFCFVLFGAQLGVQFFRGAEAKDGGDEEVMWLRNMRLLRKQPAARPSARL
jgi:hypothetical protein